MTNEHDEIFKRIFDDVVNTSSYASLPNLSFVDKLRNAVGDRLYRTVVVDPPWEYEDKLGKRGAQAHYDVQHLESIAALPIPEITEENAHLWLWTTNSMMEEAFPLLRHWGFTPKTILTWHKPGIGVGHYLRNNTEHCILGVRGKLPSRGPKNIPSLFHTRKRLRHSQKPNEAYEIIRALSPSLRLDVYAREPRTGFDRFGNELLEFDEFGRIRVSDEYFIPEG